MRRLSVDQKRVRDWRKNKTELQRLSEEDNKRARLSGGDRKKASEELEAIMGYERARHKRMPRKMIRAMAKQRFAIVSGSRDEEFL